jgi:hypothetical protein
MLGARASFDGIAVTEHSQSSYDMVPNPDLVASALAYMTEAEGLDAAIFPMGRSLGKPGSRSGSPRSTRSSTSCPAGDWSPDSRSGCTTTPASATAYRRSRSARASTRTWSCCVRGASGNRSCTTGASASSRRSTSGPARCSRPRVWITGIGNPRTMQMCLDAAYAAVRARMLVLHQSAGISSSISSCASQRFAVPRCDGFLDAPRFHGHPDVPPLSRARG